MLRLTNAAAAACLAFVIAACGGDGDSPAAPLVPVASVTVTPNAPTVKVGATATLAATLKDEQNNVLTGRAVAWSSSAPAIATVDAASGVVTGVATGTATITATSEGKAGSTTATVSAAVNAVDQILLAPALDTI